MSKDQPEAVADKPTLRERLYDVPVVGTAMRVQDRYKDDDADQHAAAIGFFGFMSLFPVLLLALSVAGFLLSDDPAAQARFADTLVEAIPGFQGAFGEGDSSVRTAISGLSENAGSVGLIGLVSLLFTGLKVINSAQRATLAVFHIDVTIAGFRARASQVGILLTLGMLAIVGVAATALVGAAAALATDEAAMALGRDGATNVAAQVVATVAGLFGSMLADFLLFVSAYKLLSFNTGPRLRHVWPGAVLAAVGWTGLKAFGATYVTGQIAKTNASIGALGGVVGLLLLLYLAGRVYVYGAELSAVLRHPGEDLAERHEQVQWQGEDPDVLGPVLLARKAAMRDLERAPRRASVAAAPRIPLEDRPRTAAPAAEHASPAVSERTRSRLDDLDAARRSRRAVGLGGPTGLGGSTGEERRGVHQGRTASGGPDVRGAAAVTFAVGAVAALAAVTKPWKKD